MRKMNQYEMDREFKMMANMCILFVLACNGIFNLLRIFIPPMYRYFQSLSVQTVSIASCFIIPSIFFLMK